MLKGKTLHKLDSLFILLIFGMFAVVSLLLVALGAGMYQRVVDQLNTNNEVRSSLAYIANKVRTNDQENTFVLEENGGVQTLCLRTPESGFVDYIYFYDGYLRELPTFDDVEFAPEFGDVIVSVQDFEMEKTGSLYTFTVTDNSGETTSLSLCERSGSSS